VYHEKNVLAKLNPTVASVEHYYTIGVVFNSPRSCLRAETIAQCSGVSCAAFSANDLTALTFGCERGDAEKFFPQYIFDNIYLVHCHHLF
jgi:phosphoenolpyruvate synthase/pyruvate phosphate dikinase